LSQGPTVAERAVHASGTDGSALIKSGLLDSGEAEQTNRMATTVGACKASVRTGSERFDFLALTFCRKEYLTGRSYQPLIERKS
jgi:hypothetical protein